MGILDEAIKEHLELKRQHGADQSELKKLEDEAFGASERPGTEESVPDPLAEAPTQFMPQPELESADEADVETAQAIEAEDVETGPPPSASSEGEPAARGRTEIADLQEPPVESAAAADEPPAEEQTAMEHEAVAEAPADEAPAAEEPPVAEEPTAGHSTEERHAIAEHPTEMYDVEAELENGEAGDVKAELGDAEPADAEPEVHALSEEDEEFWDEKRLSDELDQALEAPVELQEPEVAEAPEAVTQRKAAEEPDEDTAEGSGPEERTAPTSGKQDVLDETPDFLEEKPEDDELWFEQKPPKDFDFDD